MDDAKTADLEASESSLPSVQIEGGDVLVVLSDKDSECLLLPSEELKRTSSFFAAALNAQWSVPKSLHPSTSVSVWCYGLRLYIPAREWHLERIVSVHI